MFQVSISSNGTPQGTRIQVDGHELLSVKAIQWAICDDELGKVQLDVVGNTLEVEGMVDLVRIFCPYCGLEIGTHSCSGRSSNG